VSQLPNPFHKEVGRRIGINEGCKLKRYRDSLGIWTIGIGYNLERGDAVHMLKACGADYNAVMADHAITDDQAHLLFGLCFGGIESAARNSLAAGVYDSMADARRFVLADLVFNLGEAGWCEFTTTRALLSNAQQAKNNGTVDVAHRLFNEAADHLAGSAWANQVGDRAKRNIAMIRSGAWVNATGDGTA